MLTFGCDPEVFVTDESGQITTPSWWLKKPKVIEKASEDGGFNRDGMALEINPEPSSDIGVVCTELTRLLELGSKILGDVGMKIVGGVQCDISQLPTNYIHALPRDVWELGCDPDYSAYSGKINRVCVNPREYTKRFAGGHIFLGHEKLKECSWSEVRRLVRLLDFHVGIYSVLYSTEGSIERRKIYGKAGAFRYNQRRGLVEYRTPDSEWLHNGVGREIFERASIAFIEWSYGFRALNTKKTQEVINSCLRDEAAKILHLH